uniref:Golgi apparatus protein 1 n=1 Tax=Ciona savignyi TaxID=51511 RepID=H2Y7T7_CIOSA
IADSKECQTDIEMYCPQTTARDNLSILTCLSNRQDDDLSTDCHHYIWQYKLNITMNPKFDFIARQLCKSALEVHKECVDPDPTSGKVITCLLDFKDQIKARSCVHFLDKISVIVFGDFRLICDFVENCYDEISSNQCGRNHTHDLQSVPHTQGQVVACLEEKLADGIEMSKICQHQIIRLSELSADDFNLDRNLYFKCKVDRENMCPDVQSGEGRVYKCLFNHKFDERMSSGCRNALTIRQKLVAKDYKASFQLQNACAEDIVTHQCLQSGNGSNDHSDLIGLSGILLCLEIFSGERTVSGHCEAQLQDFRAMLMSDYNLSPEITHNCAAEIHSKCSGQIEKAGATIHCLMNAVKDDKSTEGGSCQEALMTLIKETNTAVDYTMDVALATDCNETIHLACDDYMDGDPMILPCLIDNLYSLKMTTDCQQRLLELQYFISKDFNLDPKFHKACKSEASRLCHGAENNTENDEMPLSVVLSCLHRHIPLPGRQDLAENTLSPSCTTQVHRMLRQRALDYNLNPSLEAACRVALGEFCSIELPEKGGEFVCLQDHLENLTAKHPACGEQITQLTVMEGEDPDLENVLIAACEPMLQRFCNEYLYSERFKGEIMECLIENKDKMSNRKCADGVTHFQLIEMKDYHFSSKFVRSCKDDIQAHCPEMKSKADVVKCLSLEIRNSVLGMVSLHRLAHYMFLPQHENIEFVPGLHKACQGDCQNLCHNVEPGKAMVIECLRKNKDLISPLCRKELFKVEKEEIENPKTDFKLMRTCKSDIKSYCLWHLKEGNPHEIVDCLIHNKKQLQSQCRELIKSREGEMLSDIELDPDLKQSCDKDMNKYCAEEMNVTLQFHRDGKDPHGVIYACLKKVHTAGKEVMSKTCDNHIKFVIEEENQDYKLDPQLMLACVNQITALCDIDHDDIAECLKSNFYRDKITNTKCEVARLLLEGKSDIMADPVLHEACAADLDEHCSEIPEGKGRKVNCLTRVLTKHKTQLTHGCRDELAIRKNMWAHAAKVRLNLHGVQELSDLLISSENSSYLLSMITLVAMSILILGTLCGRCTKRTPNFPTQ